MHHSTKIQQVISIAT